MVLRKLTVALLSIGVMLPGLTHALTVRDIKTKSALGEPFRAEVELTDVGDLTEEEIKVSLANPEDFERLGIERIYFLTELRFDVSIKEGRSLVKITSNKRVTEPFLDFVIRISWPNNTRLQEVTAFLDPPMTSSQLTPVAAPVVVMEAKPVIEPSVVAIDSSQDLEIDTSADTSYRVRKNDTLWNVARRVRPSTAISVPKMMTVLHKANPQAFIANDINMLRNGEVLRVPTLSEMQSVSQHVAVKTQTPIMAPQAANKPLARQQIDATNTAKTLASKPQAPRAQMKLIAPTGDKIATAGHLTKKEGASAQGQSQHGQVGSGIAKVAKPVAEKAKVTRQLAQELAALEHKVKTNDHRIALQNAKLAALEAQLKARRLAAEHATGKQKMVEKSALEKKALATMVCAIATQSFLSSEAKAAPAPEESGSSMMPIIGGGLLVAIIALIFFLKSKGKKAEPQRPAAPAQPVAKAKTKEKSEPKPIEKQETKAVPKPAATPKVVEPKKVLDPLEEAQPYLEMERFPQAVGILTKALVQTPDRSDIHLKLLEIFAKQKDRQSFEEQLGKLELLGEIDAIIEAEKFKALLPPAPKVVSKEDGITFERVAKPAVVEETSSIQSLEDLEKDFAMSLSQPNMKALDIEIRPDPVFEEEVVQQVESSLDQALDFSFAKEAAPEPVVDSGLDFQFKVSEPEPVAAKESSTFKFDSELSLDSLDDFLAEHKTELTPAIDEVEVVKPETSFSFDQALADFKDENNEKEPEINLTEGFELEEFAFAAEEAKVAEPDLAELDVDFSVAEVVDSPDFDLNEVAAAAGLDSVDLSEAAAAFDQDLSQSSDTPEDDLDLDFDVSIASDDVLADLDKEFSFLATTDENSTRLDLARAYLEMGDRTGARDLLDEVVADGSPDQKNEAQGMLVRIG